LSGFKIIAATRRCPVRAFFDKRIVGHTMTLGSVNIEESFGTELFDDRCNEIFPLTRLFDDLNLSGRRSGRGRRRNGGDGSSLGGRRKRNGGRGIDVVTTSAQHTSVAITTAVTAAIATVVMIVIVFVQTDWE